MPPVSPSPGLPRPHASHTLRAPPSVSYLANPFQVGHPSQGARTIAKPANPSPKQDSQVTRQMGPARPFLGGCDSKSPICAAARMGCGSPRFLFVKPSPTFSLEVTFGGCSGAPRPPAEPRRGAAGRGDPREPGGAGPRAPGAIPALITCWRAARAPRPGRRPAGRPQPGLRERGACGARGRSAPSATCPRARSPARPQPPEGRLCKEGNGIPAQLVTPLLACQNSTAFQTRFPGPSPRGEKEPAPGGESGRLGLPMQTLCLHQVLGSFQR